MHFKVQNKYINEHINKKTGPDTLKKKLTESGSKPVNREKRNHDQRTQNSWVKIKLQLKMIHMNKMSGNIKKQGAKCYKKAENS